MSAGLHITHTTTPSGKAMFEMIGVRERVARARAEAKTLGRPRFDKAMESAICGALQKGDIGMHKIAATFGVGTGTVQRIKAEMPA
jgi:hypothetical protein